MVTNLQNQLERIVILMNRINIFTMKQIVLILISLSFIVLCGFSIQKNADEIIWSKDYKLTWEDFKGKAKNSSTAGAMTISGIRRNFSYKNGKITINAESIFFKKNSWVKDYDKIPSTLEHEQLHFDIAELFARKFRKVILETRFKKNGEKAQKEFLEMYTKIDKEKDAYQSLYDEETTNPRNEPKQKEWVEKVAKELAELEGYATPEIEIDLNKKSCKK